MGKFHAAAAHLQVSLNTGQQSGHFYLTMNSQTGLGYLALAQYEPSKAIAYTNQALVVFQALQIDHVNLLAVVWLLIGRVKLVQEEHEKAEQFFLKTLLANGRAAWEALDALAGLVEVHAHRDDSDSATRMLTTVANSIATAYVTRQRIRFMVERFHLPVMSSDRVTMAKAAINRSFQNLALQIDAELP